MLDDDIEIHLHPFLSVDYPHVARQQGVYVQLRESQDAPFQEDAVPTGEIRPSHILGKNHVSREEGLPRRPVKGERTGRMPGYEEDLEVFFAERDVSLAEDKVDVYLREGEPEELI